ncbi:MAG: tetratricopeptide repeat protein [Chloroflexi bacterium]|nr:tetratricopeptide repeat protein [Chloroflexota bacterium]
MNNKRQLWIVVLIAALGGTLFACGREEPVPPTLVPATPEPVASPTLSASENLERGMDYYEQGDLEQAVVEFEEAIRLDPDYVEAHYNLGLVYADRGEFGAAIAEHEQAIELAPDLAEAHNGLGNAHYNLDRIDEALAAYHEAIRLDPSLIDAYFNLGHAYAAIDQHADSLAAYLEANRLKPDDFEILHNIGVAYIKQGMPNEASIAWEQAVAINPDSAETHYVLGLTYSDLRRYDEAVVQLSEALGLDPGRTSAYKHLGVAYYAMGQDAECIAAFATYLVLHPDDPDRAMMEATIAELRGSAAVSPVEYRNTEGGYIMHYSNNMRYGEEGARVVFAGTETAIESAFDSAMDDAIAESPVVICDVTSVAELAGDLGLAEDASPDEFLTAAVENMGADMGEIESGMIGGYPAVLTDILGDFDETPYRGGLSIIIVEDSVLGVTAMASPEQWDAFRSTFLTMVNSLSFE